MSAVLDTGETVTCMNETVYRNLTLQLIKNTSIVVQLVTSSTENLGRASVHLTIGNIPKRSRAYVARNEVTVTS